VQTWVVVREFLESIAVIALLAIAYGMAHRFLPRPPLAAIVLGAAFGLAAVFAMFDPLTVMPGVIVDMRSVPAVLAGGFLGPVGAGLALAISASARIWIGGIGVVSGVAGLCFAVAGGLLWARLTGDTERRGVRAVAGLGLLASTGLCGMLFLPAEIIWPVLSTAAPIVAPLNLLGVLLTGLVMERERLALSRERNLKTDATTDVLTDLLNRRGFEAEVERRTGGDRAALTKSGQALLLIDIDHFKAVNDTHGHDAGDAVLRGVADRMRATLRRRDVLARIGGEEMAVHLLGLTRDETEVTAGRLRDAIAVEPFDLPGAAPITVTISIGVHWSSGPLPLPEALSAADLALYEAKRDGRDRVVVAA
jgi:diguanylate cyclase